MPDSSVESKISREPEGLAHTFRALRSHNFRLFFSGQAISLVGNWMQQLAMSWLVYRLTGSAFLLGVVSFTTMLCNLVFVPFAGALVDRVNRHRLLMVTQFLAMIQALVLAAVVMTDVAAVWNLIVLSAVLGTINAFDMPTRQSFVIEMVDNPHDLGNAIALNSSLFNAARLIGPTVAGILVAAVGEAVCFLINGVSYIAVIACLLAMKITPKDSASRNPHLMLEMKEGFSYVFGFPPIRYIILLLLFASLVAMPYVVLLPVFVGEVLNGQANTLGYLTGSAGVGALVGAIYLASRKNVLGLDRLIVLAGFCFGAGLIFLSFTSMLILSLAALAVTGFGMVVMLAASNTVVQTVAEDNKRGRVMGYFVMAFMGLTPFGSLMYGSLASAVGTPMTFLAGGILCLGGVGVFAWKFSAVRGLIHEVYVSKGITV